MNALARSRKEGTVKGLATMHATAISTEHVDTAANRQTPVNVDTVSSENIHKEVNK